MAPRLKRILLAAALGLLATGWGAYGLRGQARCAATAPDKVPDKNAPNKDAPNKHVPDKDVPDKDAPVPEIDPFGPNAGCYVCHITFIREKLSRVHLKEKVDCIKCHGISAAHANDEDVGATKPDKIYKHDQIDKMCGECHEKHDAPARQVVARFIERKLTAKTTACTDCHGTHKIEQAAEEQQEAKQPPAGG